jgi:Ca2+-binding RTX toxin-like protein
VKNGNRALIALALVAALCLISTATAVAARVVGDGGPNTLTGTPRADLIVGRGGDDTIDARGGCDHVFAGPGNDTVNGGAGWSWWRRCERLFGGTGTDTINGGAGRDFISGGRDDDVLNGGAGSDKIFANQGRDRSDGGAGNDVLWALSRKDVAYIGDPNGDELSGGPGNDRFRVRDGEVDVVHCGDGHDTVLADQFDQIDNDCERVLRRDVTSLDQVGDQQENTTEDPAPAG